MTGCEEAMIAGGRQKRPRSRHGRCIWRDIVAGQSRGMCRADVLCALQRGRWLFPFLCVPSFVAWFLEIPQQPLDVVELELRAEAFAEAPAQFFQNAPRALHVDLARHLDRGVVAVLAPAQGPPERVGLLLGARRPEPVGLSVRAGTQHALLLHRLGEVLRAPAQSFERAALRVDRAVRVAFSKLAFCIAHGVTGAAELIHLALPLLALAQALLAQLLHQLLELIAQRLLISAQLAHLVALLALLALLTLFALLAALAALAALAVAPLVLALLERAVAQLLLLADHVAELVERGHHVVVAV